MSRNLGRVRGKAVDGFVYLAYSDTGHYKIGRSYDPVNRIKVFKTKMPVKVQLIHVIPCDNVIAAESDLHQWYHNRRYEGEWFSLTKEDVNVICNLAGYASGMWHELTRISLRDLHQRHKQKQRDIKKDETNKHGNSETVKSPQPQNPPRMQRDLRLEQYVMPDDLKKRTFDSLADELASLLEPKTQTSTTLKK